MALAQDEDKDDDDEDDDFEDSSDIGMEASGGSDSEHDAEIPNDEVAFHLMRKTVSESTSAAARSSSSAALASDVDLSSRDCTNSRKKNPIHLFYTEVSSNPYHQPRNPSPKDRHYCCNFAKPGDHQGRYFTITGKMNGSTTGLISHLCACSPDMYKLYENIKQRDTPLTISET
ncbi:hypothetical protein K488DRAFT_75315, partial [Vararia minispora EC-137]